MLKANWYLNEFLKELDKKGVQSPPSRAFYRQIDEQGNEVKVPATTRYITKWVETYDLAKDEVPIIDIRPIFIRKSIGELLWMYKDKSNVVRYTLLNKEDTPENQDIAERLAKEANLDVSLEGEYGVKWWNQPNWLYQVEHPELGIVEHNVGDTYGSIIKKYDMLDKVVDLMRKNPYNRRAISSMWQVEKLDYLYNENSDYKAALPPCFYAFQLDVREIHGVMYLDMILQGRSSDYLMASNQDRIQYAALIYIIANQLGYKPGELTIVFANTHVYNGQEDAVIEMKKRIQHRGYEEMVNKSFDYTTEADKLEEIMQQNLRENLVLIPNQPDNFKLKFDAEPGMSIYDIKPEMFSLEGYNPIKPQIKMPIAE